MNNKFNRIPEQIKRLIIVISIFFFIIWIIKVYVIPEELKESGIYRTSAINHELAHEFHYAGNSACAECHEDQYETKYSGYHRDLSCESCHGPGIEHIEDPDQILSAPTERKFCPSCHAYNISRPTGFPQINPQTHNPLEVCIECHDPHDPVPPETPKNCSACHAQISRTKAISHHIMLKCEDCHETPEQHKIEPRSIKPSIPKNREFCGKCHGNQSKIKDAPKIGLDSHESKYLCWQCHYPHMPEVK